MTGHNQRIFVLQVLAVKPSADSRKVKELLLLLLLNAHVGKTKGQKISIHLLLRRRTILVRRRETL